VNISDYKYTTSERHQRIILEETGFKKFTPNMKELLIKESELLTSKQSKPRLIFMSLVDFLQTKKIQVPTYNTLAEIITESLKTFERNLVQTIDAILTEYERELIEDLLEKEDSESVSGRYTLTALKNHSHSVRAGKIKENIADYEYLEQLFKKISPVLDKIKLPPKVIK